MWDKIWDLPFLALSPYAVPFLQDAGGCAATENKHIKAHFKAPKAFKALCQCLPILADGLRYPQTRSICLGT